MSHFAHIFDVFSRSPGTKPAPQHHVPQSTRMRILMWCGETFTGSSSRSSPRDFWEQIHRSLRFKHAVTSFSPRNFGRMSAEEDATSFLCSCDGGDFLDFIEYIFRTNAFANLWHGKNARVEQINELIRIDDLPYHVTAWVEETVMNGPEPEPGTPLYGPLYTTRVAAYPKVVLRDTELVHTENIAPALQLLQRPHFVNVNAEFVGALEDLRKGNIGESMTKCGSAFESFMKIICERKKWDYDKDRGTAAPLVKTMIAKTTLAPFFEAPFLIIATLRNKLSTAHGAGADARDPCPHHARYAINATASVILLLADEAGEG